MDAIENPADELIKLAKKGLLSYFDRVGVLMDAIYKKKAMEEKDYKAIQKGQEYRREKQALFDQQK